MPSPNRTPRWYHLTPGRFLLGVLAVEILLLLSEHFRWFSFNQHKGSTVLIGVGVLGVAILLLLLWFVGALIFRRRFQFTLRTLLLLVLVCAMSCSWFAAKMQAASRQRAVVEMVENASGLAKYDYELTDSARRGPFGMPQLRGLLGDDFFADVVDIMVFGMRDEKMQRIEGLSGLRSLFLDGPANDEGLEHLQGLANLESLWLQNENVTDAGLAYVQRLPNLKHLWLDKTAVGDAGLAHLMRFDGQNG